MLRQKVNIQLSQVIELMCDKENAAGIVFNRANEDAFSNSQLKDAQLGIDTNQLSASTIRSIEKLLQEKEYWRKEALNFSEETCKLQHLVSSLKEDREKQSLLIDSMRKDEVNVNNRLSTMILEHRELKNHWLLEKSDLQTRFFQIQGVNTQLQGTLKKREKDYEKLQSQLSKLIKGEQTKALGKEKDNKQYVFNMSQPIKAASSNKTAAEQQAAAAAAVSAVLRDCEVSSLRISQQALLKENHILQSTVELLQKEMAQLSAACDTAIARQQADRKQQQLTASRSKGTATSSGLLFSPSITVYAPGVSASDPSLSDETIAAAAEDNVTVHVAAAAEQTAVSADTDAGEGEGNAAVAAIGIDLLRSPPSPASSAAATTAILPAVTPGHRTVTWLIHEEEDKDKDNGHINHNRGGGGGGGILLTSQMKRLRAQVEYIASGGTTSASAVAAGTDTEQLSQQMTMTTVIPQLKQRLQDALRIIQEQDLLIHQALLGDLPIIPSRNNSNNNNNQPFVSWEELAEETAAMRMIKEDEEEEADSMLLFSEKDFLPPASPATYQLLTQYGWSVPRQPAAAAAAAAASARHRSGLKAVAGGRVSFGGGADSSSVLLQMASTTLAEATPLVGQLQSHQPAVPEEPLPAETLDF